VSQRRNIYLTVTLNLLVSCKNLLVVTHAQRWSSTAHRLPLTRPRLCPHFASVSAQSPSRIQPVSMRSFHHSNSRTSSRRRKFPIPPIRGRSPLSKRNLPHGALGEPSIHQSGLQLPETRRDRPRCPRRHLPHPHLPRHAVLHQLTLLWRA
jgi:hypothetical protein